MLSVVASLTPYSDFNQSPRNMYQCQMAKQTMGFPIHATEHRADNKTYRLHTPQTPLARTRRYCGEHSHIAMISCLRKQVSGKCYQALHKPEPSFILAGIASTTWMSTQTVQMRL